MVPFCKLSCRLPRATARASSCFEICRCVDLSTKVLSRFYIAATPKTIIICVGTLQRCLWLDLLSVLAFCVAMADIHTFSAMGTFTIAPLCLAETFCRFHFTTHCAASGTQRVLRMLPLLLFLLKMWMVLPCVLVCYLLAQHFGTFLFFASFSPLFSGAFCQLYVV